MTCKHLLALCLLALFLPVALSHKCFGYRMKPCNSGHCVADELFCNGDNDCGDWSDELHCQGQSENEANRCLPNTFNCGSESGDHCIPISWVCDGMPDCPTGRDELGCTKQFECKAGFKCGKECIPNSWVCDGVTDCLDKSDEQDCGAPRALDEELESIYAGYKNKETGVIFTRKIDPLLPLILLPFQETIKRIQEAIDNPCTTKPCNNGICEAKNTTAYACHCPDGFTMGSSDPFICLAA